MVITGINFRHMVLSPVSDFTFEGIIPFEGEDKIMTKISRNSHSTEITKYRLTQETVDQFRALIEKYNVTDWTDKTPAAPKINDGSHPALAHFLTLNFEDGTSAELTFRETENGSEAAGEFRKLFITTACKENSISFEEIYPNLKECREIKETHGPVAAVETGHFSSGMMMGSNEQYSQTVEKIEGKDGTVRVTIKRKRGDNPEQTCSKEIESDIFSKVQEISDRENLPSWNYVCKDPNIPVDYSMIPTDYTSNSWLNIYYDDSLITGCPRIKRTIGKTARELGGEKVDDEITALINECVTKSGAKVELSNDNPYIAGTQPLANTGFWGMKALEDLVAQNQVWTCKACNSTGQTGRFCSECGSPRS